MDENKKSGLCLSGIGNREKRSTFSTVIVLLSPADFPLPGSSSSRDNPVSCSRGQLERVLKQERPEAEQEQHQHQHPNPSSSNQTLTPLPPSPEEAQNRTPLSEGKTLKDLTH
ncbi:hypothetical protein AALO_G00192170 [Alosa alosa]|uniref:Uncharacterized protein n=1 Tax=Alosa alosa TaxID=278164 RepID=A0AAV6G738_9TELE|nr:hypothetical protein AALO_G00192170 [Alosa alosa]